MIAKIADYRGVIIFYLLLALIVFALIQQNKIECSVAQNNERIISINE